MVHKLETTQATMSRIVDDASSDRLMDYTRNISQWVRLSGSDDEQKAFDYIDETLRSWGIETISNNPVCLVSLPIAASLTLTESGEQVRCITHSFSIQTSAGGVEADLIYVGRGEAADYDGLDVAGKIALVDGSGSPGKAVVAEGRGALGVIHISPADEIREMIISPVWGSPTPDTFHLLPTLPHVSVNIQSGETLKAKLATETIRARITTEIDTGWRPLPLLVASIKPEQPSDDYVLLSGHVDSWHYGALDNGTANASMLETARVLQLHRGALRREVRVAFWSGHSHARYATSAWFVDEHWVDLHDHCVAHVNIDGPGARGATDLTQAPTTAESFGLARDVIEALSGQRLDYHRMERMGDQSLWGVGVPAFYVTVSSPGPDGSMEWHHTPLDTMDYVDPDLLVRDAQILLGTVYRLASDLVLQLDQTSVVNEIQRALSGISEQAGEALDLSGIQSDLDDLLAMATRLRDRASDPVSDEQAAVLNHAIMAVSRHLMPVNYTERGPFEQDLALSVLALPGLQGAITLAPLPEGQDRYLLETQLRRERNRVRQALRDAGATIESALVLV